MVRGSYVRTEKHKKEIGLRSKTYKRNPLTKEQKENISKGRKGQKHSEEHKLNIGNSIRGNKNGNWKGGQSIKYPEEWTDVLRESVRIRDDYVCQECGIHQDELIGRFKQLDIHHIDYDKTNCNPTNLITLCRICHLKTNYNREEWKRYFEQ